MPLSTAETNVAKVAGALKQEGNTGLSVEQKAVAAKSADKVAKDFEKRFGVTGALDIISESIPANKLKATIEDRVETPAKRTNAETIAKRAQELGAMHYGALAPAEQGNVRGEVDKVITHVAEISTLLGMGGINKTAFIEAMVNDPLFAKKVREQLKEQLDKPVEKFNLTELRQKVTSLKDEIAINTNLKSVLTGTDLNTTPAIKTSELNIRQTQLDAVRSSTNPLDQILIRRVENYRALRGERANKQFQLNKVNAEIAGGGASPARLAELTASRTSLLTEIGSINTAITPFQPSTPRETTTLEYMDTIEKTDLSDKNSALDVERRKTEHEAAVAETKFKTAEDSYIDGLTGVIERSTQEYLKDKLTAADQPDPEKPQDEKDAEAKKKKEEKERIERKGLSKIRNTLRNAKGKVNKAQADLYFSKLLTGDPRSALEPMLAGLPVAERDALLADPAFCENAAMLMVRTKLESGKITKDNVNSLADTAWGEKIIDEALKKENHATGVIDKLDGRLQGKNIMERIRGFTGEHKKSIILALLAAIATGMLYPAVVGVLAAEGLVSGVGTMAGSVAGAAMSGLGTAAAAGAAGYATYQANES